MSFPLSLFNLAARQTRKSSEAEAAETQRADRVEACKTYIEQTKLLVTLASAFLVAPAALLAIDPSKLKLSVVAIRATVGFEVAFILSVLCGYVVLATIVGVQDDGTFNVYRGATRFWSLVQLLTYLGGLGGFVWIVTTLLARGG